MATPADLAANIAKTGKRVTVVTTAGTHYNSRHISVISDKDAKYLRFELNEMSSRAEVLVPEAHIAEIIVVDQP